MGNALNGAENLEQEHNRYRENLEKNLEIRLNGPSVGVSGLSQTHLLELLMNAQSRGRQPVSSAEERLNETRMDRINRIVKAGNANPLVYETLEDIPQRQLLCVREGCLNIATMLIDCREFCNPLCRQIYLDDVRASRRSLNQQVHQDHVNAIAQQNDNEQEAKAAAGNAQEQVVEQRVPLDDKTAQSGNEQPRDPGAEAGACSRPTVDDAATCNNVVQASQTVEQTVGREPVEPVEQRPTKRMPRSNETKRRSSLGPRQRERQRRRSEQARPLP